MPVALILSLTRYIVSICVLTISHVSIKFSCTRSDGVYIRSPILMVHVVTIKFCMLVFLLNVYSGICSLFSLNPPYLMLYT